MAVFRFPDIQITRLANQRVVGNTDAALRKLKQANDRVEQRAGKLSFFYTLMIHATLRREAELATR